jgi:hypothetical protein
VPSAVGEATFATVELVSGRTISEPGSGTPGALRLVRSLTPNLPTQAVVSDRDPYTSTVEALDRAVLDAQISRLNTGDQGLVRRRLGLVGENVAPAKDNEVRLGEDRALGKLRHPCVQRPAADRLNSESA